jgi:hypothetical protein
VKKRNLGRAVGLFCASSLLSATVTLAQNERGDWPLTGSDAGQNGVQKDEVVLTADNAATAFKFLWKIKLGQPAKNASSFSEPLLAGRLINAQGFKDFVYWSSADTLYAVDSELGTLTWKKQYNMQDAKAAPGCGVSSLGVLMEPPAVINFGARRPRTPGTPPPPPPPIAKSNERKLGVAPGGGYFGLKGIYVLTPDGVLHEQVMTTGADFAPPVKFLPAANGSAYGLNFTAKTIFTATGHDCDGVANGLWAIDLSDGNYTVRNYSTEKLHPLALTGPAITLEGTSIFVTGSGTSDPSAEVYAGSVVAVGKNMKVQDWYTPEGGMGSFESVSPAIFTYKGKQLVVAPGKDGSIALLDATSLGGADHHTPLFETAPIAGAGEKHGWDGFATWQDKDGAAWVFASVAAGVSASGGASGTAAHGAVVAFKLGDTDGKLSLTPAWVSKDMVNPAPPRIANGLVVALAGGDASNHATLYVLNAATGAELYSSKDQIPTYTKLSGVSFGDSHAFFTDHNNVLYSFGIGIEH